MAIYLISALKSCYTSNVFMLYRRFYETMQKGVYYHK